jgi:hypothetical protein
MEGNKETENTGNKKWLIIGIMAVVIVVLGALLFLNLKTETTGEVIGEIDTSWWLNGE